MADIRRIGNAMIDIDDITHVEWNSEGGVLWIDLASRKRHRTDHDITRAGNDLRRIAQEENRPNLAPPAQIEPSP